MTDPTTETLPDGAIRVTVPSGRSCIVASGHLVPDKVAQLLRLPPAAEQQEGQDDG